MLVWNKADLIIIALKLNLFSPSHSLKIAELALNNNHSLTQAFLTGDSKIIHVSFADDNGDGNDTPGNVSGFYISGVNYHKACVKVEDFWDVAKNSRAKKNNGKDQMCKYVFYNNIIILYLR